MQVGDKIIRIPGLVDNRWDLSFILRNVGGKKHIVIGKCRVYETVSRREPNWFEFDPPVQQQEYFNII
jgi:hypothetical protein